MKCNIITYSGKIIDICNPTAEDLDIIDINTSEALVFIKTIVS